MRIDLGPTPPQQRCDTKTHLGNTPGKMETAISAAAAQCMKLTGKDNYRQYRSRCCATGLETASGPQQLTRVKPTLAPSELVPIG